LSFLFSFFTPWQTIVVPLKEWQAIQEERQAMQDELQEKDKKIMWLLGKVHDLESHPPAPTSLTPSPTLKSPSVAVPLKSSTAVPVASAAAPLKSSNTIPVAADDEGPKKRKLEEGTSDESSKLPPCKYGEKCTRKNPAHFKEYSHPQSSKKMKEDS
jgi:hypothetical protein